MKTVQSNARSNSYWMILPAMLFFTLSGFAQQATPVVKPAEPSPVFSNPTFLILLVTALILMGIIISLSGTIRNLADTGRANLRKKGNSSLLSILVLAFLLPLSSSAQEVVAVVASEPASSNYMPPAFIGGLDSWVFVFMMLTILVEVIIVFGLIRSIRQLLIGFGFQTDTSEEPVKPWINWKWLDRQLNDAVPLENEAAVMTDHEYDGIRELDNNLPPWWKYGFYFTIVFGIVYLFNYHISHSSPLQTEEYQAQMMEADSLKKAHLKEAGAIVDENNVVALTDAASLTTAKAIYIGNCVACHGQGGEGGVGPNLTDAYWINGGGIQNVFKTLKYGVPAKGMIAWQGQIKPEAMQKLASYVLTLQGTNPANPKAPQGDIWNEVVTVPTDSLAVKTDTSKATAAMEVK